MFLSEMCSELKSKGHRVLNTYEKEGETILVYQLLPTFITCIQLIIIKENKSVIHEYIQLKAKQIDDSTLLLMDIEIFGKNINKGYGTILVQELVNLAKEMKVSKVVGNISPIDWKHIARLQHFYEKLGFLVTLKDEKKYGSVELLIS